jgi:hypothetical protein
MTSHTNKYSRFWFHFTACDMCARFLDYFVLSTNMNHKDIKVGNQHYRIMQIPTSITSDDSMSKFSLCF